MSNQPEQENQQFETVTPQELREALLAELEASKQAIAGDATDPQAWMCHAGSLEALGRRRQAVDALERAIALDPYHPDATLAWVGALLYLGRLRSAWRAFGEVRARWGGITTRRNERRYGPASLYNPHR